MTSGSAPTPSPSPKNEAEYARKLALAILSTLESKGFLTKIDVDTILAVAHRAALQGESATGTEPAGGAGGTAADGAPASQPPASQPPASQPPASQPLADQPLAATPAPASRPHAPARTVLDAPVEVKRPLGPAVLGTRWVKPDAAVTPVRTETEDLVHEAGAVKIVAQGTSEVAAPRRLLAPPIVTAGKEKEGAAEAPEPPIVLGDDVAGQPDGGPEQVAAQEAVDAPDPAPQETKGEGHDARKGSVPVVIDFEMD
ncbi:hypothetical protein ACFOPQ_13390 [Deinococcus antarcticus]|uniref:Uncharacterized protein n=1 Tax=Deinococcus antarcticus TaxID=1298767 RepID=A0ABV8A9H6_9DEIO